MRRERSEIKVGGLKAYKISEYDNVFIVLNGYHESFKNRIWFSEKKQKYFLRGKIIEWDILTPDERIIRSYPLNGSISFVDHRDWKMYSTCKYDREKEKRIMHVHYGLIDYILLDFNAFDWKS